MLFEEISKASIQALKDHDKQARAILSVVYGKFKLASIEKRTRSKLRRGWRLSENYI